MGIDRFSRELVETIFEWDVINWSRCIPIFNEHLQVDEELKCLELGGRRGGMSLWMALCGHDVLCSDLSSPESQARPLHDSYDLNGVIRYSAIDALEIPYRKHFDIVMFKSVLGGVSREGNDIKKTDCMNEIYKSLKPKGKLIFAENLRASWFHRKLRRIFVKWGGLWNYLEHDELDHLLAQFSSIEYCTVGFFGAFGRNEDQRRILAKIDKVIDRLIPKSMRYIVFVVATK